MEAVLLTCAQALILADTVFSHPHLSSAQAMEIVAELQQIAPSSCELFSWDANASEGT